ncbi:hypothetical protein BDP55DRAFT_99821 [Colletotrichum godetiae]|uniref:Uncharacterized protein n=1 Tax=Colletotrichum godetiae TaxID=1209918 RepID=A0AAJ0ETZ6_9PEZI|nr:uncharacterized protein BDP55DRAFT_99821 [Colletotrichum godetiae]KAK1676746.1 hypothetical protein BDP55DRAFT_99821 [Colletotrichum godetiae]
MGKVRGRPFSKAIEYRPPAIRSKNRPGTINMFLSAVQNPSSLIVRLEHSQSGPRKIMETDSGFLHLVCQHLS